MKTLIQNNDLILQNYGAAELKAYSEKATYRAFGITIMIVGIIFLLFYLFKPAPLVIVETQGYSSGTVIISTIKTKTPTVTLVMPMPNDVTKTATGTEKIFATPVPIKDELVPASTKNIASIQDIGTSSSIQGTAKTISEIIPSGNGSGNNTVNNNPQSNPSAFIEDDDTFQIYDKDPEVDMINLQKSLIYPELPKRAGIEGRVIVRVLIGADGSVLKSKIDMSDNSTLDEAALKAVMTPGLFKPAIQHKIPVQCWISIPIKFRLR